MGRAYSPLGFGIGWHAMLLERVTPDADTALLWDWERRFGEWCRGHLAASGTGAVAAEPSERKARRPKAGTPKA
jgi:hypothetical protein